MLVKDSTKIEKVQKQATKELSKMEGSVHSEKSQRLLRLLKPGRRIRWN